MGIRRELGGGGGLDKGERWGNGAKSEERGRGDIFEKCRSDGGMVDFEVKKSEKIFGAIWLKISGKSF